MPSAVATRRASCRSSSVQQLPNAVKPESQEICFVPDGDYAGFVAAAALKRGRTLPTAGSTRA